MPEFRTHSATRSVPLTSRFRPGGETLEQMLRRLERSRFEYLNQPIGETHEVIL